MSTKVQSMQVMDGSSSKQVHVFCIETNKIFMASQHTEILRILCWTQTSSLWNYKC